MASLPAEFNPLIDIERIARRAAVRAFVILCPRSMRHVVLPRYWSARARRPFGWCSEKELVDLVLEDTERKERSARQKQLKGLANTYKKRIRESLARAGAVYTWKEDGSRYYRKIQFKRKGIVIDDENYCIYYHVDTIHLPSEVLIKFLRDPAVVETVCASCDRVVEVLWSEYRPWEGFRYRVNLSQSMHGITSDIPYSKALAAIEARKSSTRLTVVVGAGEFGKFEFIDIDECPHLIIAGTTGSGKSTSLKQIIITLALRNNLSQLRFIMMDFKAGVELTKFKHLPHLLMPLVKTDEEAIPVLEFIVKEINSRMGKFAEIGVDNISEYNQRRFFNNKPLPPIPTIIIVIDELVSLMLNKELRADAERLLTKIVQLARAAGIHLIACTQRPSTDVIIGIMKANIPTRLCFSVPTKTDSRVVIDIGDAAGLYPPGRMIYMHGSTHKELHSPYISPDMLGDKIANLAAGRRSETRDTSSKHDFTPMDYMQRALDRYGGKFGTRNIWEDFRTYGVGRTEIERVAKQYENQQFELNGRLYKMLPGTTERGAFVARQIIDVTPAPVPAESDPDTVQQLEIPESDKANNASFSGSQIPESSTEDVTAPDNKIGESQNDDLDTDDSPDDPDYISAEISGAS